MVEGSNKFEVVYDWVTTQLNLVNEEELQIEKEI